MTDRDTIAGDIAKQILKAGGVVGLIAVLLVAFMIFVVYSGLEQLKDLQLKGNEKLSSIDSKMQILAFALGKDIVAPSTTDHAAYYFAPPAPTPLTFAYTESKNGGKK